MGKGIVRTGAVGHRRRCNMNVIYICGPFTACTPWEIECNVRRAETLGLEVAKLGAMPLIPHANTRYFHGHMTPEFWYEGTLELLKRCDALIVLNGWKSSRGARGEVDYAIEHSMPVFHELHELATWLGNARSAS